MLLLFVLSTSVLRAYIDSDLDGVEDAQDRCPNTSMTELVDLSGCTVRSLVSYHHYDIVLGGSFSQLDYRTNELTDTYNAELQIDYYYKNFSIQGLLSYYSSNSETYANRGLNDTYLSVYYQWPLADLSIRFGAGVIFPTYKSDLENEAIDYTASVDMSYQLGDFTLLGRYGYTLINDDDIDGVVAYQNTHAFNVGLGMRFNPAWYSSVSYNYSNSIYTDVEALQSISLYTFYSFDANWFGIVNYAYGLSDSTSNHYLSLKVGYYF